MSRASRQQQAMSQAAEVARITALRAVPPAPGTAPLKLPEIDPTVPPYNQAPFLAWINATEEQRQNGTWDKDLPDAVRRVMSPTIVPPPSLAERASAPPASDLSDVPGGYLNPAGDRVVTRYAGEPTGPPEPIGEAPSSGLPIGLVIVGVGVLFLFMAFR